MMCRAAFSAVLLLALGACGEAPSPHDAAASAQAPAPVSPAVSEADIPELPEAYRRTLERAFRTAAEGRDPTMACTGAIARAAGSPPADGTPAAPDAVRAFELCYIEVRARYLESILASIAPDTPADARDNTCLRVISHVVIGRSSLGTFANNVGLDRAALDRQLVERVRVPMQAACPNHLGALDNSV